MIEHIESVPCKGGLSIKITSEGLIIDAFDVKGDLAGTCGMSFDEWWDDLSSYDPDDAEANDPDGPEDISYKFDEAQVPAWKMAQVRYALAHKGYIEAATTEVKRLVKHHYPTATSIETTGDYNEDGLMRVYVHRVNFKGFDRGPSDLLADDLDEVLMELGENSGDDYLGSNEITL